jgi:hypothetical protein
MLGSGYALQDGVAYSGNLAHVSNPTAQTKR